ncbi:hypothetical protein Tco_0633141 [Tanacetum coccineum]
MSTATADTEDEINGVHRHNPSTDTLVAMDVGHESTMREAQEIFQKLYMKEILQQPRMGIQLSYQTTIEDHMHDSMVKCWTDEKQNVLKQLKKANTSLTQELKECKTNLDESSRALGEATSSRDSSLIALQTKQTELEKYTALN